MNCNLSVWDNKGEKWVGGEAAGRPLMTFAGYKQLMAVKTMLDEQVPFTQTTYTIFDGYGNSLPHYFSETAWYSMRHPSGSSAGTWCRTPGKAKQEWGCIRTMRLTDEVNNNEPDPLVLSLLRCDKWYVICHRGIRVQPGLVPYFDVPDEEGLYGLLNRQGGVERLWAKTDGVTWFKSMHAVWTFIALRPIRRKGTVLIRSTGAGKWEELPNVDPFM